MTQSARDISTHNVTSFMYEIMNREKYEPVKQRDTKSKKEQARIQEVIEETEELEVTEKDIETEETQGMDSCKKL